VKWHRPPNKFDRNYLFQENPCHVVHVTFWDVLPAAGRLIDFIRPRKKKSVPFLTQMGVAHLVKVAHNFLNLALMQSHMGSTMKILKSCSKVIQRILRAGNWLRYSFFSAISRVNSKPTFRFFNWFWPTPTKQDTASKNNSNLVFTKRIRVKYMPLQSIQATCAEKFQVFFAEHS